MIQWTIKQEIDLAKGDRAGGKRQSIEPLAYPGNANAHGWRVTVYNNGLPANLSGNTITAYFKRADGNTVLVQGIASGNMAQVVFPPEVYAVPGIVHGLLNATASGQNTTALDAVSFIVRQNLTENIIDPGSVIPASIDEMLAILGDAQDAATNAANATKYIANTYDGSKTYSIGDYVIYNGKLYRCNTAIPTPEEWTDAHWTEINITDAVGELVHTIDSATEQLNRAIARRADGLTLSTETGVLQLTSGGVALPGASVIVNLANYYTKEDADEQLDNAMAERAGSMLTYDESTSELQLLNANGDPMGDPVVIVSGSGGGGGAASYTYIITLVNNMDSRNITIAEGSSAMVDFNYSTDDGNGNDDGTGVGTILVGNVRKGNFTAQQGRNTLDLSPYLAAGTNNVKVRVEDSEGAYKTITYTVNVVALSITTTFEEMGTYRGDVIFNYTPIGAGSKTVHFLMDGTQFATEEVTSTGRARTRVLPAQTHGGHTLEVYATALVDGNTVTSNTIQLGMIWIAEDNMMPAITSTFETNECSQGEALRIGYLVYDPTTENATVALSVIKEDGTEYSRKEITAGRTAQVWAVQDYPLGNIKFRISCGDTVLDLPMAVSESDFDIEPTTDSLEFEFSATGRSNGEDNPAHWNYQDINAAFSNFGWTDADGWHSDSNGETCLRFLPGETMQIPYELFNADVRSTGATIEVDLATRDVRDYDSVVVNCLQGGRGFIIASQYAELHSEQTGISLQFKEDSRIHLTITVEQSNENRFISMYIDGVLCGVQQYATSDNFQQPSPVGLSIGANSCGIDLYRIRIYRRGLNRAEVLDNFIYDRPTLAERINAAERNNILDENDEVTIEKLPSTLPYMVISCEELPQYKGDKKPGCHVEYVDRSNTAKSWTADGVETDVQGTSSQGYPVKNYKVKLKSGITYTVGGETAKGYAIHDGSILTKTICIKADYASSESANNTMLAEYYNDIVPWKDAPQQENPKVRQGIEGTPCVVFWQDANNDIHFLGKYNLNCDKDNESIFGFTDEYPDAECWEFKNNTSNRTLFLASDYSSDDWLNDFEARYPDKSTDYTHLKRVTDWVASTARLDTDSEETKAAKLAKFKSEFEDYFIKTPMIFYYMFTEVFLLMDSRAKNMFLTTYDGTHWFGLPYDFDSALGINNEGALSFEYDLEDTDEVDGAEVFTGQKSALWKNVRDAFGDEIKDMYTTMRSSGKFNYETIKNKMSDHQSVWPEALWNEDAFVKYLQPYLLEGVNNLKMLQGNKASQRDWWLFNGFRYRDSKYQCGDSSSQFITLRCYNVGDITVTPYSHIWPRVKYGSYTTTQRGKRNQSYVMHCGLDSFDDTETYIYSADRIVSVGDLSPLMVGYADFSMATKLQDIRVGSHAPGYQNTRMEELYVGNNELLTEVNVENCVRLTMPIDLSGCASLQNVYAKGSAITAAQVPNGGHLKKLELPATVTNLTIQNQKMFETLDMEGYSAITTLRIEGTPNVPIEDIVLGATSLDRVRLVNMNWDATDETTLTQVIDRLATCHGMTANGDTISEAGSAVVTGRVSIASISGALLERINNLFPELVVVVNGMANYLIRYLNYDGTELYKAVLQEGSNAIDPVQQGLISAPTKPDTETESYVYTGWGTLPTNVHANASIVAQYQTTFRVRYLNWDGTVLQIKYAQAGESVTYTGSTPTRAQTAQYTYTFDHWDGAQTNIQNSHDVTAVFTSTVRTYTVRFLNGTTVLQTVNDVPYGGNATYTGTTPTHPTAPDDMRFSGWNPTGQGITGNTDCYAQFVDISSPMLKYLRRNLANYNSDVVETIADSAFYQMTTLQTVTATASTIGPNAFNGCTNLTSVDLTGSNAVTIGASAFAGCTKLTALFIRSNTVSTLSNTNALAADVFGGVGKGVIYVPAALVDDYKAATNWSAFADRIFPIDAYPVTDFSTISDTWDQIIAAANDGSYKTTYKVGNTKKLTVGNTDVYMQIAAIDGDDLANDGGKAPITWLCKNFYANHKMNDSKVTTDGWPATAMRSWLISDVLTAIPETVRNRIVPVHKTYYDVTSSSVKTSDDSIWIPSTREVCFTGSNLKETSGVQYSDLFKNDASRIKCNSSGSARSWWLRSAASSANFYFVNDTGTNSRDYASCSYGVVFGFCF